MNCIWCDSEMVAEVSWSNLFVISKPKLLCAECEASLEKLNGKRCTKCSRLSGESLCSDCKWWKEQGDRDAIEWNYSTFTYNERMQEMIAKWKYRGDYLIGKAFEDFFVRSFREKFSKKKNDIIAVPIPLSEERLSERCFNQAEMLADFLPIEKKEIISRIHGEKQSKKTRKERIYTENPFFLKESINKSVILVDDIYTTGTTLRHAASLLREHGCPKVYALTLVRG